MMHRIGKRILAFLLVFTFYTGFLAYSLPIPSAEAATLTELQQQRKILQQKQAEAEKNIKAAASNIAKEQEKQAALNDQIDVIQDDLENLRQQIAILEQNIIDKQAQYDATEADRQAKFERFKQRLRTLYMAGDDTVLSIMLGSTSFYDMLSSAEWVKRIVEYDNELVNSLIALEEQLEQERLALEADKVELQAAESAAEQQKTALYSAYQQSERAQENLEASKASSEKDKAAAEKEEEKIEAEIKAEIARLATMAQYVGGTFGWPVPNFYNISSGYGYRWGKLHKGIDISGGGRNINGATIVAANSGKVITAVTNYTPNVGYGKYVMIDHGGGYVTLYGHCSELLVSVGQTVAKGDPIARVGTTGNSTGYHLHFEIREKGTAVNPLNHYSKVG